MELYYSITKLNMNEVECLISRFIVHGMMASYLTVWLGQCDLHFCSAKFDDTFLSLINNNMQN